MSDLAKYVPVVYIVYTVQFLLLLPVLLHSENSSNVLLNGGNQNTFITGILNMLTNERSIHYINYKHISSGAK